MNSLKTVFIVAVLLAIAAGVYISINNNPQGTTPPGVPEGWSDGLNVQMPDPGSATGQLPGGSDPRGAMAGINPQMPVPGGSMAPPFAPTQPAAPADGSALPYPSAEYRSAPVGQARSPGSGPGGLVLPSDTVAGADLALADRAAAGPTPDGVRREFADFMAAVQRKLDQGSLAEVLEKLSLYYGNPRLSAEESRQITELLDQVAGTVIYSRQHFLEDPYTVRPGDSIQKIAQSYDVPWQLLAKINGIRDPERIEPGRQLKVVRGPFNAVIHLDDYEITLLVGGCYAGRFPIGIGLDHSQLAGTFLVKEKSLNPTYYGPDRTVIDADDPGNPLGDRWIGLGNQIGIHGTSDPQGIRRMAGRGSICLGNRDIEDVYDILSVGSRVVIQR